MNTLSDFEILEEARHRFGQLFAVAPIQHLRFLLHQELEKMSAGSTSGYVMTPVIPQHLEQAKAHVQNNFIALGEACKNRELFGQKRTTLFTRALLLSARMWQLATFHRDEFSVEGYCDVQNLMTVVFNYRLPALQLSPEEDLLELHASGDEETIGEAMDVTNASPQQPDLREQLNTRRAETALSTVVVTSPAPVDLRERLTSRLGQRNTTRQAERPHRRKCYQCRKRGHQANSCSNAPVDKVPKTGISESLVVTAGSSRGSARYPARDARL